MAVERGDWVRIQLAQRVSLEGEVEEKRAGGGVRVRLPNGMPFETSEKNLRITTRPQTGQKR